MSKKMKGLTIGFILVVLFLILGFYFLKQHLIDKALSAYKPPPVAVTTLDASEATWTKTLNASGSIVASEGVDISSQVSGKVRQIYFKSGDYVTKGQNLIKLDDRLEKANLAQALSSLKLAQLDYRRNKELRQSNNISQASLDKATANLESSQADVDAIKVKIDFMNIKAPFNGKLGIRQVNLGDYISPNTEIVSLQNLQILYIDFATPAINLPLLSIGEKINVTAEAYPGEKFTADIVAIDSSANTVSRNIIVRSHFDNSHGRFVPGMYTTVEVVTNEVKTVIPVPQVAITYSLYGNWVFILDKPVPDKASVYTIKRVAVNVVMNKGELAGIQGGIKPGDKIITSNQQELKANTLVYLNNDFDKQLPKHPKN